jgi:hypothetical protein
LPQPGTITRRVDARFRLPERADGDEPYAESLCGEPMRRAASESPKKPRGTSDESPPRNRNENAELAKAGSAFFVGGCGVSGGLTGA